MTVTRNCYEDSEKSLLCCSGLEQDDGKSAKISKLCIQSWKMPNFTFFFFSVPGRRQFTAGAVRCHAKVVRITTRDYRGCFCI